MTTLPEQKLFIDGAAVDATSGDTFVTVNPATGDVICTVQSAGADDVDRAVVPAQKGFQTWAAMTGAAWMPVDPVPICPTRLPLKSTPS